MTVTRKIVGSGVTEADLNALNYLVAQYIELTDNINLSKTTVIGEYGSYYLDSTVNDDYTGTCKLHYNTQLNGVKIILHLTWYNNNDETTTTTTIGADGVITVSPPTGYTRFDNNATIKIQNGGNENNTGYNITFTCDNPIIQADDTSTVTATLKKNNTVQAGVMLRYMVKHGTTLINTGMGITDSNGQISITYTGTGTGVINIIVYYGTLLQETYELKDCMFVDIATTGKHNINWWNTVNDIQIATYDDGTKITNPNSSGYSRDYAYDGSTLPSSWNDRIALMESQYTKPFAVEFTIVDPSTSNAMFIGNGSNTVTKYFSQISATANSKIKIECDGSTAKFYRDGTLVSTESYTVASTSAFAFIVQASSYLKYRDFCIYPI